MLKRMSILMVFVFSASVIYAQDKKITIRYGETFTGEITNQRYEIPNVFEGTSGDVVIFEMQPVDTLGELTNPVLTLVDSAGRTIADTSESFSYGSATLVIELPGSDTYTILATRADGSAGTSVGEFTLSLFQPPVIEVSTILEDEIASGDGNKYYMIEADGTAAMLTYRKQGGDYDLQITINQISDTFGLEPLVILAGSELTNGEMNVPEDAGVYIISIGPMPFSFSFGELTADYALLMTSDE